MLCIYLLVLWTLTNPNPFGPKVLLFVKSYCIQGYEYSYNDHEQIDSYEYRYASCANECANEFANVNTNECAEQCAFYCLNSMPFHELCLYITDDYALQCTCANECAIEYADVCACGGI